jgi:hypothetical protein
MADFSLIDIDIDIGKFAKPATVLIDKISDAIGVVWEPHQIKRVAKAEAEVELIKAETQTQLSDIRGRAFRRLAHEESKKQKNIEDITQRALPDLKEDAEPHKLEDDWLVYFFDRCRLVSDQEMQRLWSRVLAGEANSPGAFSKRTLKFLSDLERADADSFTRLCGFAWVIGSDQPASHQPLIYDVNDKIYRQQGLTFSLLNHLAAIGLIHFQAGPVSYSGVVSKEWVTSYYDKYVRLKMPKESDNPMVFGTVLLTQVGQELFPICGSQPVDGFFEYIVEKWKDFIKENKSEQGTS